MYLTSFVGRRRDSGKVRRLLADARLVTLTGVGGTGKTRLAVRVAAEVRRAFPDGAWFVDLTELREPGLLTWEVEDPDALAYLVAAALGLRDQGGVSPVRLLAEHFADRRALLVLDNCEHLLPACAVLVDRVLRACPGLRIIATSREPLAVTGEVLFAVPPLRAPRPGGRLTLAGVGRYEAVALFATRAQAVEPGFDLTVDNRAAVAEICHRLDGLPLAIELAAAWTRILTPQQILDRLADRFTLLSRGSRGGPARQRTLQASMEWSFELCSKPERMLWTRLSVFVGGFHFDAVEGICADEALPARDMLDVVAGLVDKSVISLEDGHGQARFRMLETIREYGRDNLLGAEDEAVLRHRHRDWYQRLATRASAEWISHRQAFWHARLPREYPNLRAAMEFCLTEPGEQEAALRLAVSLPWAHWRAWGLVGEGRRLLDRALAQATAPTAVRSRAFLVSSHFAYLQRDTATATRLLAEGEELARRLGASAELALAAIIRGAGALLVNDLPVAVETLDRARSTQSGPSERDLEVYLAVLMAFGLAAGLSGDQPRAIACQQEILAIVEPRGGGLHRSFALWMGGFFAWLRGDLRQAARQVVEPLRLERAGDLHDQYIIALCLEVLAWIAAAQRRHRRAATLLGAAESCWADLGTSINAFGHYIGHHIACEQQARDGLGDAGFTDAFEHGRILTPEDVFAYALEEPRRPGPARDEDAPALLTRREHEVAGLVADGLSNREIAGKLVVSQRTAESHVEHILIKLGATSRTQVAAWKAAQQPPLDQD